MHARTHFNSYLIPSLAIGFVPCLLGSALLVFGQRRISTGELAISFSWIKSSCDGYPVLFVIGNIASFVAPGSFIGAARYSMTRSSIRDHHVSGTHMEQRMTTCLCIIPSI